MKTERISNVMIKSNKLVVHTFKKITFTYMCITYTFFRQKLLIYALITSANRIFFVYFSGNVCLRCIFFYCSALLKFNLNNFASKCALENSYTINSLV